MSAEENASRRFWAKVDKRETDECWEWTGCASRGYGQFRVGARMQQAHRVAYELLVGPTPEGLEIDHLCRNRACVNPSHLEPVTHRVNLLRGETLPAANVVKTHCPLDHPYDEANTRLYRGKRVCRECHRREQREYRARKMALAF